MHFLPYPYLKLDKKTIVRAIVLTVLGLLFSLLLCMYIKTKTEQEDRMRFEYEAEILSRRITSWLEQYSAVLVQTRAYVQNTPTFDEKKLYHYIERTEIFKRYTGLQGVGYIPYVVDSKIEEFKKKYPEIKIWPAYDKKIGFISPVLGLYPNNNKNFVAMGFNVSSEKVRRETLIKARDTNSIVATGKVTLVQETSPIKSPSFILFLPIYKEHVDLSTVENRRKAITGFLYSPFQTYDLFNSIFSNLNMIVDIKIYDEHDENGATLLYNYGDADLDRSDKKVIKMPISIEGMELTLYFTPLKTFPSTYHPLSLFFLLVLGAGITLIVLWTFLITSKQVMEARRVASQKENLLAQEKKQVQDRDEFLSIASHELKTPLTSLKLQAQIMIRNLKNGNEEALNKEKISNLVILLDAQSSRLNRLVDDMLDISRLRTGKFHIELSQTDLKEVVEAAVEKLMPSFIETTHTPPTIEFKQKIVAKWDRLRIEQVITNLLSNAIRYGNHKPVKIKVYRDEKYAYIQVIDHGRGIAPENMQKIFDRFERAGMSAYESSGMGLGLYIAKQIVIAHNGEILIESELQKGSTFTVKLPL